MLQGEYLHSADVGRAGAADSMGAANAWRREKRNHDLTKAQLRREQAERRKVEAAAKRCQTTENQRKRFFDRRLLHPVVSLPPDPLAIAQMLALLIAIDRRTGFARRSLPGLRFERDQGMDLWSAPSEVLSAGVGDCAKFVRQEGAFRGTAVGCVRLLRGFHVWLRDANGTIIDVCVERGMPRPAPEVYSRGVYAPIATAPLRIPAQIIDTPPQAVDEPEMEQQVPENWDEPSWPTFDDTDEIDIAGTEELVEIDNDEDVSGAAATAAAVVGLAGAVGSILGTVYGGPAAGAAVGAVANGAANLVASFEQQAPPRRSNRVPDKRSAEGLHAQAVARARASADPQDALLAAALAAVSSENPKALEALRNRLRQPRTADPNPNSRLAIEAALVTLAKAGYDVPIKHHRPRFRFSRAQVEAARARYNATDEPLVEGVFDATNYEPGCPGTCPTSW